jgi:hypothetical protein
LLQDVADDRVKGYELLDEGLREKNPTKIADGSKALREVDEMTRERIESLREK